MTVTATHVESNVPAAAVDAPAVHPETGATAAFDPPLRVDVAIVGAGPVGLALAGWLMRRGATRALSVALIDARDASQTPHAANADPRAMALSHGSRMLLETLGWPVDATPIRHIHISQRGHFGRTQIDYDEHDLPALGYVVRYGQLVASLAAALRDTPVQWLTNTTAQLVQQDANSATLALERDGVRRELHASVVINAEGGVYRGSNGSNGSNGSSTSGASTTSSALGTSAAAATDSLRSPSRISGAAPRNRDYQQSALVATVRVARPRANFAWERFTSEGPLALLPLSHASAAGVGLHQDEFSLVWCGRPEASRERAALPDAEFLIALHHAFGDRMGAFTQVSGRSMFPLGLHALTQLTSGRIVAIGNAAQTLHPVAGQGLNLGLRDAHALVEALGQYGATVDALHHFARSRAADRRLTIAATDTLARLFTVDLAPVVTLRGCALAALDFVPAAKRILARQMMFGQRR
ncbi:UbiH/UbiF/VisC/COQ6 family ubiquinone biosynthesis hydroxylase [Burkholderia sp. L27(2015)]|uniref:UbiH/UbiF/VisC/COQ6 family ubiquinone biosynthesis hydroxylase n=1 Tax=Burkholderia sp. L27(2015) TaxID=1641858 RepID=UPI00131D5246|nr:UbiH/UbiF/VisC/COQ6 family ubiquinone biosynthesis hydroxylase [Burkholderia sp. L27(2015)]